MHFVYCNTAGFAPGRESQVTSPRELFKVVSIICYFNEFTRKRHPHTWTHTRIYGHGSALASAPWCMDIHCHRVGTSSHEKHTQLLVNPVLAVWPTVTYMRFLAPLCSFLILSPHMFSPENYIWAHQSVKPSAERGFSSKILSMMFRWSLP